MPTDYKHHGDVVHGYELLRRKAEALGLTMHTHNSGVSVSRNDVTFSGYSSPDLNYIEAYIKGVADATLPPDAPDAIKELPTTKEED